MSLSQITKHYRSELQAYESHATHTLTQAHAHIVSTIQPHLNALYQQIEAKQQSLDEGEKIPLSWLYEQNRLPSLERHVETQINAFGEMTRVSVVQAQQHGVALGKESAQAQIQVATGQSATHPSPSDMTHLTPSTHTPSPLSRLFGSFGAEASKDVKSAFTLGLSLGQKTKEIASGVMQAIGTSLHRAITMVGDALISGFRGIVSAFYRANSDAIIGWRWIADLMGEPPPCAACTAQHGSIHPLDEELDGHLRCRCQQEPVQANDPDIQSGADWLDEQDASTQREVFGSDVAYDLWKNNDDISLQDFVGWHNDPVWGRSLYQKSAKELASR